MALHKAGSGSSGLGLSLLSLLSPQLFLHLLPDPRKPKLLIAFNSANPEFFHVMNPSEAKWRDTQEGDKLGGPNKSKNYIQPFLFFCGFVYIDVYTHVWVHGPVGAHVEARGQCLGSSPMAF